LVTALTRWLKEIIPRALMINTTAVISYFISGLARSFCNIACRESAPLHHSSTRLVISYSDYW